MIIDLSYSDSINHIQILPLNNLFAPADEVELQLRK